MPAPATTGQLRTKVSDMEIGDYILAGTSFAAGKPPDGFVLRDDVAYWGTSPDIIPVNGTNQQLRAGQFYFIKVARGLLVADRVCQTSISYDVLNTSLYIQGLPWDAGNIIPTMTSNTAPSGVASASSQFNTAWQPFQAFDKNSDLGWVTSSGVKTGWIEYDFPTTMVVRSYSVAKMTNDSDANVAAPKDWTFEGYNETTGAWQILDQRVNQTNWNASASVADKRTYSMSNKTAYKKYRLNVSANNGSANYIKIGELEMYDTVGIIRSLTGGVAYADANGNSATADASKGAWPTNNEWDKYIVNFDPAKIQAGKTLDDVFHWLNIFSWTQDTWVTSSSARVVRGYEKAVSNVNWYASNSSSTILGFRPCFEYKEV